MGRNQKYPLDEPGSRGGIVKESALSGREIDETVMDRLGLNDMVCQNCNARVPTGNDTCRKCGAPSKEFRRKKRDFSDE